jgi:integrase
VGKKPPLTPDQVALIRMIPGQDRALRDLALFNTALDTSFRGSDLVRLRVSDVATPAGVSEIVEIRQKKTESRNARPVQARLSSGTRDSLRAYLAETEKLRHEWLFTGQGARWSHTYPQPTRYPLLGVVLGRGQDRITKNPRRRRSC